MNTLRGEHHRHGTQLALAMLLAYGLALALRLPEALWAAMSALLITRAHTGATLGTAWLRVLGTVAGAAIGLSSVWLATILPIPQVAVLLAVLGALAYASVHTRALASAPVSALIVGTAAAAAGQPVLVVAVLRVAAIGLGVLAGLAVTLALSRLRAARAFWALASELLLESAQMLSQPDTARRPALADRMRRHHLELAQMAQSADRESKLMPWGARPAPPVSYSVLARLLGRTT